MNTHEDLDIEVCLEVLQDVILDQGTVVYRNEWDSGGPGAGADAEVIFFFQHLYWPHSSTAGFSGPFERLEDAVTEDFAAVTDATTKIECWDLPIKKVASLLWVQSAPEGDFTINGTSWRVSKDKLVRVRRSQKSRRARRVSR